MANYVAQVLHLPVWPLENVIEPDIKFWTGGQTIPQNGHAQPSLIERISYLAYSHIEENAPYFVSRVIISFSATALYGGCAPISFGFFTVVETLYIILEYQILTALSEYYLPFFDHIETHMGYVIAVTQLLLGQLATSNIIVNLCLELTSYIMSGIELNLLSDLIAIITSSDIRIMQFALTQLGVLLYNQIFPVESITLDIDLRANCYAKDAVRAVTHPSAAHRFLYTRNLISSNEAVRNITIRQSALGSSLTLENSGGTKRYAIQEIDLRGRSPDDVIFLTRQVWNRRGLTPMSYDTYTLNNEEYISVYLQES